MSLLDALTILVGMIQGAEGIPSTISGFAALIAKAQTEQRDISAQELELLRQDDDALASQLDKAIEAARSTP